MTVWEFGAGSEVAGLDTERILNTLASHGVEYILVGGLAAIAHGSTLATADADVLPRRDADNLERLLRALQDLGGKVLVDARRLAMEDGEPWEVDELRRGPAALDRAEAWHFTTEAGPVDIVMTATGVGPFEAHADAAEERDVFGIKIRVAGIGDLIASKNALDRPKDRAMLDELLELRGGNDEY